MSKWITDRRPTEEDADSIGSVWATYNGKVFLWDYQGVGEEMAWMPITPPEPYVKPKRWTFFGAGQMWTIFDEKLGRCGDPILPTREAAERIAAIYEEVMP